MEKELKPTQNQQISPIFRRCERSAINWPTKRRSEVVIGIRWGPAGFRVVTDPKTGW